LEEERLQVRKMMQRLAITIDLCLRRIIVNKNLTAYREKEKEDECTTSAPSAAVNVTMRKRPRLLSERGEGILFLLICNSLQLDRLLNSPSPDELKFPVIDHQTARNGWTGCALVVSRLLAPGSNFIFVCL
jgi:hypothetical protein